MKKYTEEELIRKVNEILGPDPSDFLLRDELKNWLKRGWDTKYFNPKFDWNQLHQVSVGLWEGIDVSSYADPKYTDDQMRCIRFFVSSGVDIKEYIDIYDWPQLIEISKGLRREIDISIYANPAFDAEQMRQIREGLEYQIDAAAYADPNMSVEDMYCEKWALLGTNLRCFKGRGFEVKQLQAIRIGHAMGRYVGAYADPKYTWEEMCEFADIPKGAIKTIDLS